MRAFARHKSFHLIDRVGERMAEAHAAGADEKSVHDLRTSIRRLSECLRAFEQVFPGGEAGKLRRKVRKLMDLAAEVRNRDISADLFRKAGLAADDPVMNRLAAEQVNRRALLMEKLSAWRGHKRVERWRGMLQ